MKTVFMGTPDFAVPCLQKLIDMGLEVTIKRIINVPKRGIGATTLNKVQAYALEHDISYFEALRDAERIPGLGKAAEKLQGFVNMMKEECCTLWEEIGL